MCLCVCIGVCYISAGVFGGQKKLLDPLEVELLVVVSHPVWLLATLSESLLEKQ